METLFNYSQQTKTTGITKYFYPELEYSAAEHTVSLES